MAIQLGPIVFVVIVIGGLGSLNGALIASLFIGILQTTAVSYDVSLNDILGVDAVSLWYDVVSLTIAQVAPVLPYLLLVLMLIFKPRGLFGTRDV
jgi:branched-chain amino acid transport system permease protein